MFIPCNLRVGSAYYEFQYCPKPMSVRRALKSYSFWKEDSLLVHINWDSEFFHAYAIYLQNPYAPDGSGMFYPYGVNYYDRDMRDNILARIKEDKPTDWEVLAAWLEKADYGFYFLGV